jgi:23S rRNA (uracil1939-C5)-methyltransferase
LRKKKPLPLIENVLVTEVAAEGKALARVNDLVVFIIGAIPGDVVDLQVTKKRSSYMEARVIKFRQHSPIKVKPFCSHFGVCGGCKWQDLPYPEQLKYKQKQVTDSLQRIAKVELPEISPIIASAETTYYRNKLEFTFSSNRWLTKEEIASDSIFDDNNALGFHIPSKFDKILDIRKCYLQPEPSNEIRLAVKAFALENGISFFNIMKKEGLLRNLIIRTSTTGEVMVIVVFYSEQKENREKLLNHLASSFPVITSLMYIINNKANDSISDQVAELYKGNDYILEKMEDLQFKIGPKSFFQTNSLQAYQLYKTAREFAGIKDTDIVYDLYTGTGTIANFVAKQAKKVIGIEYVAEAIDDAIVNSQINAIGNTSFYAGDIKDIMNDDFIIKNGRPSVIITDPPRAGMHPDVVASLLNIDANRIVYVSCNPATQARDIALMSEKYKVMKVQPVDMFPHTHHVENVVLLERIDR